MLFDGVLEESYKQLSREFVEFFAPGVDPEGVANAFIMDGQISVYYDNYLHHQAYPNRAGRWHTRNVNPKLLEDYGRVIFPTGLSFVDIERRRLGIEKALLFPEGASVAYRGFAPVLGPNGEDWVSYADRGIVVETFDEDEGYVQVAFGDRVTAHFSTAVILNKIEWRIHEFGWKPWQAVDAEMPLRWRSRLPNIGNVLAIMPADLTALPS